MGVWYLSIFIKLNYEISIAVIDKYASTHDNFFFWILPTALSTFAPHHCLDHSSLFFFTDRPTRKCYHRFSWMKLKCQLDLIFFFCVCAICLKLCQCMCVDYPSVYTSQGLGWVFFCIPVNIDVLWQIRS